MSNTLKEMFFNKETISTLSDFIISSYPAFNKAKFQKLIFDADWQNRELKDRMRHVAISLNTAISKPYSESLGILLDANDKMKENKFFYMVFPEFVSVYGLDDFEESMFALKEMTRNSTSEFAIRPFFTKYEKETMQILFRWSKDQDKHVRRLSSEGCRPMLPWGNKLMNFVKDPTPILPILDNLKEDPELYVQRSVANNLNDISKNHPALVLEIATQWKKINNPGTQFIVKHACRTLLKKGNQEALNLFGQGDICSITATDLKVESNKIRIGETLDFSFNLIDEESKQVQQRKKNTQSKKRIESEEEDFDEESDLEDSQKLRIEYKIDYLKANGTHSSKVFMLSSRNRKNGVTKIVSSHKFIEITTRKHYPGKHYISIIVNGSEKIKIPFNLLPEDKSSR